MGGLGGEGTESSTTLTNCVVLVLFLCFLYNAVLQVHNSSHRQLILKKTGACFNILEFSGGFTNMT